MEQSGANGLETGMSQASVTNPDRKPSEDMLSCIICRSELRDPVLLQCLHNACSTCVDEEASRPGCGNHITCSACGVATDITRRTSNSIIFAEIQNIKALREAATCGLCRQDGNNEMVSDGFCIQCQISLCVGCLTEHRRHVKQHKCVTLDDTASLPELLKTTSQYCKDHGAKVSQACFTCERPVCAQCVRSCHKESHDVHFLNTPEAGQQLLKIKERIEHLIGALDDSKILETLTQLPDRLKFAYDMQLNLFKQAKKAVMDAISTAFDEAVFTLKDSHDILQAKASGYVSLAGLLKQRISSVSNYCHLVTSSRDMVGILSQLKNVESHLSELKNTLSHLREPVEASSLVRMQVRLPTDLDTIARSWIRPPQLCAEDPCCALEDLLEYTEDVDYITKEAQLEKRIKDQEDLAKRQREQYEMQLKNMEDKQQRLQAILDEKEKSLRLLQDLLQPLLFSPVSSSWQMRGSCWDVAVTGEGHVLVAAMEQGLKELDVRGKELSRWQPKEVDGSVRTVDVLEDGRVAVGLWSKHVVLLQRAAAVARGWVESKRISLQSPPRRLSVHADLLAVCEDREEPDVFKSVKSTSCQLHDDVKLWLSGPWLVLIQLSSGQQLHRRKLDYDICSVALTARIVVTCSAGQVKLADGSEKHVVDGHSHSGVTLWRHVLGNKAMDACFAESRRILYLALDGDNKVTAINAVTGEHLNDVVACSSQGKKVPYALSVDREKLKFLVVLSRDETLAVYSVSHTT